MKKQVYSSVLILVCFLFLLPSIEAYTCKLNGKILGKKTLSGRSSKPESKCDNQYHSDDKAVVALSTGWFNKKKRCLKYIDIHGNGKSLKAKVVNECDSTMGCDADHDYYLPCHNNIVVASQAVWKALGVPLNQMGEMNIYWFDTDCFSTSSYDHFCLG
ncbi:hypothetical protein CRYUN_Cryun26dG0106000 [Craigia yunnanensis]